MGKSRQGMEILRSWGLDPVPGPLFEGYLKGRAESGELSFLAGSDELRWRELEWALGGECDACWVVRGGYGLSRLVSRLGSGWLPRPVLGFSDVSVLLQALHRRGWPQLVHCANLQTLPTLDRVALEATRDYVLRGQLPDMLGDVHYEGEGEGALWGGNLCVLASLCGTPEALGPDPKVLFLEDINEAPYRVDRLLTQLHDSGAFHGLAGVALGRFTGCGDLQAVWKHWSQRWRVPVLFDLPFGHCPDNFPIPLGARVRLTPSGQMSWVSRST